jgi:peptide-methionine (S)-S-oxide reductase
VRRIAVAVFAAVGLVGLTIFANSLVGRLAMSDNSPAASTGGGDGSQPTSDANLEKATFGTGCFWCTEAVFDQLKGVRSVVSGYSGGTIPNPSYEQVCGGLTGHAEVVQITFDPKTISFSDLLEVFWQTHDPTTLNRQGNDVGTQYRSAIFYHNDDQRKLAEHFKQKLDKSGAFRGPIVTEITPYKNFYPAEKYHQDYFASNPYQPYCAAIIRPKVDKFRKAFRDKLKETPKPAATPKP